MQEEQIFFVLYSKHQASSLWLKIYDSSACFSTKLTKPISDREKKPDKFFDSFFSTATWRTFCSARFWPTALRGFPLLLRRRCGEPKSYRRTWWSSGGAKWPIRFDLPSPCSTCVARCVQTPRRVPTSPRPIPVLEDLSEGLWPNKCVVFHHLENCVKFLQLVLSFCLKIKFFSVPRYVPDSFKPRSPTRVSYPSGICRICSWIFANFATWCISSSVQFFLPYLMLYL